MNHVASGHPWPPTVRLDGGSLDCGSGLLLLIRKHIDPLHAGELLEVISSEPSVREDLPAWSRLTGNELVSMIRIDGATSFLISRGPFLAPDVRSPSGGPGPPVRPAMPLAQAVVPVVIPDSLPRPVAVPSLPPLSVMGVGSWPRPRWLLQALQDRRTGHISDSEFDETADDAVRLCAAAQLRAGVDVLTDGEQRRDDYASFVAGRLDNCQLIPLTDLLPYVDHPDEFAEQMRSLDVPAADVRFPAVFGRLGRRRPMAAHEVAILQQLTDRPVKVALPGPYLLTRTMWMECISDRVYPTREALSEDIVRVLREETYDLLAAGVCLVQFDEPVLTEVVHGRTSGGNRTFMCGALAQKGPIAEELQFATDLFNRVVAGLPISRIALHICRGNWTADESHALRGDYRPLLKLLNEVNAGTYFLELCTPRAGELDVLQELPRDRRIGTGVINQKSPDVESVGELIERGERAIRCFGPERVLLNPDCGFATFADNPITTAAIAEAKLAALVQAAKELKRRYGVLAGG